MSCWVVPTVAAELWGMSVEGVLELIEAGEVPFKRDYHFLLVDVAPASPKFVNPAEQRRNRPATFAATAPAADDLCALLSDEERAALRQMDSEDHATGDYDGEPAPTLRPGEVALADIADGECSWVRIRQRTGLKRLRPAA